MKNGYYYFQVVGENTYTDRSLGYISITLSPERHVLYFQCSIIKTKLPQQISLHKSPIEVYLSPVTYITDTSLYMGKISVFSNSRLFLDGSVSYFKYDMDNENQYIIVTVGGRTILFSELQKIAPKAEPCDDNNKKLFGKPFDPFNTTNSSYKWYIHTAQSSGGADMIFREMQIHTEMFAKTPLGTGTFMPDTFLKTAHYALRVAGHILRGEYTDPSTGREFAIVGLPGWNIRTKRRNAPSIRVFARWIKAINKPAEILSDNYNGYWLYYFDRETGFPVKAVLRRS